MAQRTVSVIESEIDKLQAELKEVRMNELRLTSAVHILHNLGWSFDLTIGKWKKPEPVLNVFDANKHNPFRVGDYVEHRALPQYKYRVSAVIGSQIEIQPYHHREGFRLIFGKNRIQAPASAFRSISSSSSLM